MALSKKFSHSVLSANEMCLLQFIMLLSAMGIRDTVFKAKQAQYFAQLANMRSDPRTALKFLMTHEKVRSFQDIVSRRQSIATTSCLLPSLIIFILCLWPIEAVHYLPSVGYCLSL